MTIAELLDKARQSLLDLSTRNRLLSLPSEHSAARLVHVHDERSEELFRLLVREQKSLTFVAGRSKAEDGEDSNDEAELPTIDAGAEEVDERGVAARHRDLKLQTKLTTEGLQKRLLAIYYDARTLMEEQGVNILYLALGQLEWYESESSELTRRAPLILIPVKIERKAAGVRFSITWDQQDLTENLSLAARLKEFGIKLPSFEYSEDFDPADYLNQVERAIEPMRRFAVHRYDIVLAFFSFAKFLMYRDLDTSTWPKEMGIDQHEKIKGLLRDGFPNQAAALPSDSNIDTLIPAAQRIHVVDADSSQSLVLAQVDRGDDLVVQGPPGTGKSQTITNIIASAVHAGKRVLFVAEKLAALEVVKRNLERINLDQVALELHSSKARKKAVLEELGRTLGLSLRAPESSTDQAEALTACTDALNAHAEGLHTTIGQTDLSPFHTIGRLTALGDAEAEFSHITIEGADNWDPNKQQEARSLLADVARRVELIGPPSEHLWRGVCLEVVLPNEARSIGQKAHTVAQELEGLTAAAAKVATLLEQPPPNTLADLKELCLLGIELGKLPAVDRTSLASAVWSTGLDQIRQLLVDGKRLASIQSALQRVVRDDVYARSWSQEKAVFLQYGRSLLKVFRAQYRSALRNLELGLVGPLPKAFQQRRELFDQLDEATLLIRKLDGQQALATAAFGILWKGAKSTWSQLESQFKWVSGFNALHARQAKIDLASRIHEPTAIGTLAARLSERVTKMSAELDELLSSTRFDLGIGFGSSSKEQVSAAELIARFKGWSQNVEGVSPWVNFRTAAERVRLGSLGSFYAPIVEGRSSPTRILNAFDQAFFNSLLRLAVSSYPGLAKFEGVTQSEIVQRFRKIDREYLTTIRLQVVRRHLERLPRLNTGVGALGTLHREINKRANHMALRKLIIQAGSVIQEIKPVFMMSPLSVAQFLAPSAVKFDLLVIDEASQIEPIDALGGIARCGQVVVIGDDKQLPPTRFFSRMTGNEVSDDENDEQDTSGTDVDSILGLCRARGIGQQMLRWHYRSRHHSLIAVSNREFYDNGLFIPPSPENLASASGLKFNKVDGIYDRGKTRQNVKEAAAISFAVMAFAEQQPGKTLGVVAFSEAQKQAILDELEILRTARPDLEGFFGGGTSEPFFVKNLENVQGDERDVIFISVGYGRDASGYMSMGFGPLTATGGERRLNVLISRARLRCEVFSSITGDDIDLERTRSKGAAALKVYLKFAETGRLDIAKASEREMDSWFEASVKEKLEEAGHTVHTQVGMAGFFIDLAVVDPETPGRYVLGIECDGATYHSSRSARDRDRLRQAVLEDHGWRIHRIWSADWLHRPRESLRTVLTTVESALLDSKDAKAGLSQTSAQPVEIAFSPLNPQEDRVEIKGAAPYETYAEAAFYVPVNVQIHEMPTSQLVAIVEQVIQIEQPIHREEVVQRVKNLWGLSRAGSRIQKAVSDAIAFSLRSGRAKLEDEFFLVPCAVIRQRVRNRATAESRTLKDIEMLPPSEIRFALTKLLRMSHKVEIEEIVTPVARWF